MPYALDLRSLQAPLKGRYRSDAASALVVTAARSAPSDLSDPRHCAVAPEEFPDVTIRSGLHPAAGGAGDTPCSGDILAAALAICEESTLRSVAANMGIGSNRCKSTSGSIGTSGARWASTATPKSG